MTELFGMSACLPGGPAGGILAAAAVLALNLAAVLFLRRGRRTFAGLCFVLDILAADALTKLWTVLHLAPGESVPFLPKLIRLTHVHNYGAAWSSFSGMRGLLITVTAAGLALFLWFLVRVVRHPLGYWSLLAVIAGGLGNLWNRVSLGYVIDMIDLAFMDFPVFNVADMFVVCGGILAIVYYFAFYEKCDAENWRNRHGGHSSPSN